MRDWFLAVVASLALSAAAPAIGQSQEDDFLSVLLAPHEDAQDSKSARPQVSVAESDSAESADEDVRAGDTLIDMIPVEGLRPSDEASASGPIRRPASRVLEEVVVTAQKREESQQEVPIAIQAYSGGALQALGVEDPTQLGRLIPGFQYSGTSGYTLIYLRGVGTDAFAPSSDPSVATYIDGVYMPSAHGVLQSFGGLERVEVLKGPQGTLFGRNATGGAISVITKEPHPSEIEVDLSAEYGNYNSRRIKGYFSTPVTDWLSLSLSGIYHRADEYYTQTNRDMPEVKTDAVRVKVNFHPTENLEFRLAYFRSEQDELSSVAAENNEPSLLGRLLLIPSSEDDFHTDADYPPELGSKQEILYGLLEWRLPWFDAKVIGSDLYAPTKVGSQDFDGSPMPIAAFYTDGQFADYKTWELQILSNEDSWGADRFEWIAGIYYLESVVGYDPFFLQVAPDFVDGLLSGRLGLPPALVNPLDSFLSRLGLSATPLGNDGLVVVGRGVLGAERFLIKADTGAMTPGGDGTVRLLQFPLESKSVSNFSPKVSLSVFPTSISDLMIYASWSKGFKSATYNIVNIYEAPDYVRPEEVSQYELGLKSEWLGGDLRFNAAVFQITINDLQSGFVSLLAGGAVTLENAGEAQIRGAEFDVTYVPFSDWNPGFVVSANLGYLDAVYTDYQDGAGYDERTGLFSNNLDFTGNNIVRTPKLSGGVVLSQAFPIGSRHEVEIAVDGYYNDGFNYTPQNTVKEPAYTLVNGRISYLFLPWNLRITAFGKNLTDERYHFSKFQTDFGVNQTLAPPLQYGLRLEWTY
jgi:iron complex outermembrane recepter protein